jgi:hypothetical protein
MQPLQNPLIYRIAAPFKDFEKISALWILRWKNYERGGAIVAVATLADGGREGIGANSSPWIDVEFCLWVCLAGEA